MLQKFKSINFKFFIYLLSIRRNFIPILSIYFLTLDNATANQIGIYTGIGYIASIILEIPSGYFSDRFGHKKTLYLAKSLQFLSVVFYIVGGLYLTPGNFYFFIAGAVFQALGFTFISGTQAAYYHELLEKYDDVANYSKYYGKSRANVSLISAFIIVLLPFLTTIHIVLPLLVGLLFDVAGAYALSLLPNLKSTGTIKKKKNIFELFSQAKSTKIFHISIFLGIVFGFVISDHPFRSIYLQYLGYPIIFIGFVMGLSRVFWFILGHYVHYIEKFLTMRQHLFIEILLFSGLFFGIGYFNNPYVVGVLLSLISGYAQARRSVTQGYILNHHMPDKDYKATYLSIESQVTGIVAMCVTFGLGFIMSHSFQLGYYTMSLTLLTSLSISFYYIFSKK